MQKAPKEALDIYSAVYASIESSACFEAYHLFVNIVCHPIELRVALASFDGEGAKVHNSYSSLFLTSVLYSISDSGQCFCRFFSGASEFL